MSPQAVLALQRSIGNAAVSRMIEQSRHQHGAGCGHTQAAADTTAPVQRSAVHSVLSSGGRPLDDATRTDMESRLGADFSDVRLHTGATAQRSAAEIGARAYTSGSHVVIGNGGADPHTLAHELTHVIQQRKGPVAGSDNGEGLRVSDPSDRFEREAEANARQVMSGAPRDHSATAAHADHQVAPEAGRPAVQRMMQAPAVPSVDDAVAAAVAAFLGGGPRRKIFKRDDALITAQVNAHYLPAHGGREEFERRVRTEIAPLPPDPLAKYKRGLNESDQADFMREVASIQAQLNAWKNVRRVNGSWSTVPGCNADGTWGTSAGGVGGAYSESRASTRAGEKIREWWMEEKGGYLGDSRTSLVSLKKDLASQGGERSPKFNYHIRFGD